MPEPIHNRSTFAYFGVGVIIAVVSGLILLAISALFPRPAPPANTTPISNIQPTIINKLDPTINNTIQLPSSDAQQAPRSFRNGSGSTTTPIAQREAEPSAMLANPKLAGSVSAPTPYFGYWTSDPNEVTVVSYSGFPMAVTQNRALDAYFRQIHNATPRADDQSHVARILVLNATRTNVSTEGCYLATQISISYYFQNSGGKRMTEDRVAKGIPACLSGDAEQADRDATESAIAAVARAID